MCDLCWVFEDVESLSLITVKPHLKSAFFVIISVAPWIVVPSMTKSFDLTLPDIKFSLTEAAMVVLPYWMLTSTPLLSISSPRLLSPFSIDSDPPCFPQKHWELCRVYEDCLRLHFIKQKFQRFFHQFQTKQQIRLFLHLYWMLY